MQAERIRRLARDERLARHAGFWWGLAEGLFFFIVPDVYISFAALFSLKAGAVAWMFSIAGSMIARVEAMLATAGLPYTPLLVLGGVPHKVYGGIASSLGLSLGSVLLWTVFARIVRIAPTYAVVAGVRLLLKRRIDARATVWSSLLGVVWLAFYVFYFVTMGRG